jgi:GGDEF domain-containing protein
MGFHQTQIDNGKYVSYRRIDDTYGHETGDLVLKRTGTLSAAERFRALVAGSGLRQFDNLTVTVSIGATLATSTDTVEILVNRADEALYEEKETGRNKVFLKI